jgi:SagB-type dehydrogenase family enzyme
VSAGLALLLGLSLLAAPEAPATVELPAARTSGGMALDEVLAKRRSIRQLDPKASLTKAQLSQLCWAAQGITDDKGHRTAPSARATYPLDLYVVVGRVEGVPAGLYRYVPQGHRLERRGGADVRDRLLAGGATQPWIKDSAVIFALVWNPKGTESMGPRAEPFGMVEVGLAGENLLLEVTSLGLGSTFVGGFDPAKTRQVLGLAEGAQVGAVLPVGKPAASKPASP